MLQGPFSEGVTPEYLQGEFAGGRDITLAYFQSAPLLLLRNNFVC